MQNCDLKFMLWMKFIHLGAFKKEFGNLKLFFKVGRGEELK